MVRLRPAPHNRTPIHRYSLEIKPGDHFLNWQQDVYGNYMARLVLPKPVDVFEVNVDLVADLAAYSPFDYFLEEDCQDWPFEYGEEWGEDLDPFLATLPMTPRLEAFIASLDHSKRNTNDFLVETNVAVQQAVDYVIRMEPGVQTPEETLRLGRGSCRDSAWLLVQVLAPPRHRRALRVRLPDPARRRPEADRGAGGPAGRLHGPPRLVRVLHPGGRLDRARPDLRGCSPRRDTSRSRRRRARPPRRRSRGSSRTSSASSTST